MADVAHTSDGLPRPNGGPAAPPRNFKKRWAQAVLAYDNMGRAAEDKKAAGHVAMAFKLYMEMDSQGRGAAISDEEFARACGVTSRTAQEFKKWLLSSGFVIIRVRGSRRGCTEFEAMIPGEIKPEDVSGVEAAEALQKNARTSGNQVAAERGSQEEVSGNPSVVDFRKELPEEKAPEPITGNLRRLPEEVSGNQGQPAPITGNPQQSRALARATKESPSEINIPKGGVINFPSPSMAFEGRRLKFTDEQVRIYAAEHPELDLPPDLRKAERDAVGRLPRSISDAELLKAVENEITKLSLRNRHMAAEIHQTAQERRQRAPDDYDCYFDDTGKLVVANGFKAALLEEFFGGDEEKLRLEIDKAAPQVAKKRSSGVAMKTQLRGEIARQISWAAQDAAKAAQQSSSSEAPNEKSERIKRRVAEQLAKQKGSTP